MASYDPMNRLNNLFESLDLTENIGYSGKPPSSPQRMINSILRFHIPDTWIPMTATDVVKYVELSPQSHEYIHTAQKFIQTNNKNYIIDSIERIQNPYLYSMYSLKKMELETLYGNVEERLLFHGTRKCNIDNICMENFDWRLCGSSTGHKFGKGVSFSPRSSYAMHYCNSGAKNKVMLVVKVLISNECVGNQNMDVPPNGFDTTCKADGNVIVKYYDNEFYPMYKIKFSEMKKYKHRNNDFYDDYY